MKLPRNDAEYRAIEVLFGHDERLTDFLDQAVTKADAIIAGELSKPQKFDMALNQVFKEDGYEGITLSDSEASRLRLAMFFWNSRNVHIKSDDILCLDHENRRLFIAALLTWLETFGGSGVPRGAISVLLAATVPINMRDMRPSEQSDGGR
ncbi:MAG: hypothetical protein KGJ23_07800 [Euryarchaeota archaeon]|nr:hypothetical protein [Euryarchaeota archaeon]MDE1836503.1 hypothetical protein [Euryarchaeota archaeon]MDE1879302.1 hypothetical protein [Euryarchaeota archaeon]MDE2044473.1 hypothetical protein [Thermoplasmata archaeon]